MKSICLECNRMFECDYPKSWLRDFCPNCLREIEMENRADGERDERGDWEYHCKKDKEAEQK